MATYVPNAADFTEPLESQTVESAALEFRTLKTSVNSRLATEITDRTNADTNLQVQITSLTGAIVGGAVAAIVTSQEIVGDGVAATYTLSASVDSSLHVDLYIDGAHQQPSSYTVVLDQLTLSEVPHVGALITVKIGKPIGVGTTDASLVQYEPAGTGAVATTVQAKLRESVSVLDFGAVAGGGIGDSTANTDAFNGAFAAVASGGTVHIPVGIYYVTGFAMPPKRIQIRGDGVGTGASDGTRVKGSSAIVFDWGTDGANRFSSMDGMTVEATAGNTAVSVANKGVQLTNMYCGGGAIGIVILESYLALYQNLTAYGDSFGMKVAPTGAVGSDAVNSNTFINVSTSTNSQGGVGLSVTGGYNCRFNNFITCDAEQCTDGTSGTGLVSHGNQNAFTSFYEELCFIGIDDYSGVVPAQSVFTNIYDPNTSTYDPTSIRIQGGLVKKPNAIAANPQDAATFAQGYGLGQVSTNYVIGSGAGQRDKNTLYINTTAKAITINVLATASATNATIECELQGIAPHLIGGISSIAGGKICGTFLVPPGNSYYIYTNTGTLTVTNWVEVR